MPIIVLTPSREYSDQYTLFEFSTQEEAINFIEKYEDALVYCKVFDAKELKLKLEINNQKAGEQCLKNSN